MSIKRLNLWIVATAILSVGIALLLWRYWQGPVVSGYQVSRSTLVQNVVATGRVISNSRAQIGTEITGVVTERRVQEGDHVAPGDVLVVLRADALTAQLSEARAALTQLQQSQRPQSLAKLRQAESQLLQARREAERRSVLLKANAIPREDKEQADQALATALATAEQARLEAASLAPGQTEETILQERVAAAEAALSKTRIIAEFAGTVLTRNVEPGDLVQPGRVLFEVARANDTEILVPVDERNLAVLAIGQSAVCVPDAYPDRQFQARIRFIAPTIDPQRGTVDVRLSVDPVPDYLRPDLTITANIETGHSADALAVPNDALFDIRDNRARAWIVENGRVRQAEVTLGLRGLALTQVLTGIAPGDWVLNGADVQPGDRVRVTATHPPSQPETMTSRDTGLRFD